MRNASPTKRIQATTVQWCCLACLLLAARGEETHTEDEDGLEIVGPMLPPTLPHDAALDLPEWQPDDLLEVERNQAPTNLGGGLWPAELWPLMPEPPRLSSTGKGIQAFEAPAPEAPGPTEPLPPGLAEVYFGQLPAEAVLDPQGFTDEMQQEEIGRFFAEFARKQAGIDVRVLVFGPNQKLPDSQSMQNLTAKWFPAGDGIVVFYSMGRPGQSACNFSKSLSAKFSKDHLTAVQAACAKEALLAQNPQDQLARYCIKLAVRMNRLRVEVQDARPIPPVHQAEPFPYNLWLALIAGLTASVIAAWAFMNRRRRKASAAPKTWLFPDLETAQRLMAPHCGGTMAILKYRPPDTIKCVEIAVAP